MTSGGVVPGGNCRTLVCTIEVTCASAVCMFAEGWKNTLMTPMPLSDCDSICSMLLTVVVIPRSEFVTMRSAISPGGSPVKFHMTLMTGMLMFGKISTGVRKIVIGVKMMMSSAITTNVYGRRRAKATIHIGRVKLQIRQESYLPWKNADLLAI